MAKRRTKSVAQKEYERELKLAKARLRYSEKTLHESFTITPKKSYESYSKAAERLKKLRQSNFTEKQHESFKEEYRYKYEENQIDIPEAKAPSFEAPTEQDFFDDIDTGGTYWWEDTPNEPVYSEAEIDASINSIISSILEQQSGYINPDVKAVLDSLIYQLRFQLGDKDFYEFMTDYGVVDELQKIAREAMAKYPVRGQPGAANSEIDIEKFATVLNRNMPLDQDQSKNLSELISTIGHYGQVSFNAFEDLL